MSSKETTDILGGLREFNEALNSEGPLSGKLTCRKVKLNLKPTTYDPEMVRITRDALGMSQSVFAQFIGVSVSTVQAWEQGTNPVTGAAARLMDEMRNDTAYWRSRLVELGEMEAVN